MSSLAARARGLALPILALSILIGAFAGVALSSGEDEPLIAPDRGAEGHAARFISHLADELRVSEEELLAAAGDATDATIGDLLSEGLLTDAQAAAIREQLDRLITNRQTFERGLPELRDLTRPYGTLLRSVKRSVVSRLADLLEVTPQALEELFEERSLSERAERVGVSDQRLLEATRRAAAPMVDRASSRGLITDRQAQGIVRATVRIVAHHL